MIWTLVFTDQYDRRAARFLKRHPQQREQYRKTLLLLQANPHHPSLRLRALGGKLKGLHLVSINLSHRITLENAAPGTPDRADQRGRPRRRLLIPCMPPAT